MNTSFKNNGSIKVFFSRPWNMQDYVKPRELDNFHSLARDYAKITLKNQKNKLN